MMLFVGSCWRDEGISDIHHFLHKQVQSIKHKFFNSLSQRLFILLCCFHVEQTLWRCRRNLSLKERSALACANGQEEQTLPPLFGCYTFLLSITTAFNNSDALMPL